MTKIICTRVGFHGPMASTPEAALTDLLQHMEEHNHRVVSVSVTQPGNGDERYQAFIVSRFEE